MNNKFSGVNAALDYNIIRIIKGHLEFSNAINQHRITEEINNLVGQDDFIDPRSVRRIIEDLIIEGYPIISTPISPGGYCWGGADGEALECYKRLRRKGIKILLRARRILRNSKRGQLKIW